MSRAVLLCLQHPEVVHQVEPDDYQIDPKLDGASILFKLIGYCEAVPDISTARLLERFSGTTDYNTLVKLATRPYWPDGRDLDDQTAITEFIHCIEQLRKLSQQKQIDKVEQSARTGLLSIGRR